MNREFIKIAVLALCVCSTGVVQAQHKWTLRECIDYALANNIELQQKKLAQRSAEEDVLQSKASLLPSLNFSTSQSLAYRPWQENGQGTVANGYVQSSVDKVYYNGSYSVNANWTVWNGNKNHNTIKLNKITEQQAELDSAVTANSIQERIAQLYVQILYSNDVIEVNRQSLAASKKNQEQGQAMLDVGKMSKADLAQLTTQVAQDEYNVVTAESNLRNYKLQLKQLLEISNDEEFDIVIPETSDVEALAEIPALGEVYTAALEQRPEIRNTLLGIESCDVSIDIAKAGYMPTIGITAGVGTNTTTLSDNGWSKQMKTNFDTSIGATISVPIFDNRQTKTAINKAKIQRENSMLELKNKQKELYSTIENYWLEAINNQNKYRAAKASTESEQASYELLSEQFSLGLKNIVELMTGKSNLLTAQQNELQSKYLAILNRQMLYFYKGDNQWSNGQ